MKRFRLDKSILLIILIIFVGGILRFSYLNRVPAGISDDELDTVLTAESVYYTGKTLEGVFSPFSFSSVPPSAQVPYARAPYMLLTPVAGLFRYGLGETKIPFALVSVLSVIVLTYISWLLWGKRIAIYTTFVSSFNPWSIYFGRTAFDTPLSIFFIYLFLLCLLTLNEWWLLIAYIPWFIGLFSYQGMIVLYPLVLVTAAIGIWRLRGRVHGKQYFVLTALGIVTFSLFMVSFRGDRAGTRMGEIATPNNSTIVSRVNVERRRSVQTPINSVVLNKVTVAGWQILGQYIGAFSTEHLFVSGEQRSTFSLWSHGLFYIIEFVLLIIGLYSAYRMNRNKTWFLFVLILLAPIPAAISTTGVSYALRASFMYPLFCIFIAIGLAAVFSTRRYNSVIKIVLVILYVIVITNFLHIYFIQNPVNNSEGFGFSNRVLATYMRFASEKGTKVLYIGNNVLNTYRQYVFFNNRLNAGSVGGIQTSIRGHTFPIDNVRFIECPQSSPQEITTATIITPAGKTCPSITTYKARLDPVVVAQLSDSGRVFEIYNDTVCAAYGLSEFQPMITFDDLDVEALSLSKFCTTYISKPKPSSL